MTSITEFILQAFLVSIILTFCFEISKPLRNKLFGNNPPKQSTIGITLGFLSLLFTLLIVFTINNYLTRYYVINEQYNKEIIFLQMIHRTIKDLPNSQPVIDSMIKYVDNFINIKIPDLRANTNKQEVDDISEEYYKLTQQIISYARQSKDPILEGIVYSQLVTEEKRRTSKTETVDKVYLAVIIIVAILTLICFWMIDLKHTITQVIIDFCIITTMVFCIYLIVYLINPLKSSPLQIPLTGYTILRNELKYDTLY